MDTSWDKNFPSQMDSPSSSREFMARMNYIAVAAMLYHRGVVPLDILKKRSIGSIREGINAKYVKEVQVVFSKSREQPDEVLEMFSCKFSYDDDQDALEITDGAGRPLMKLAYDGIESFKMQVLGLLLRIVTVAGALEKLPEGVVPSIQVLFYDRAPPGYVCPNFRKCDEVYAFRGHAEPPSIGRLDTEYSSMFLGVQSRLMRNVVKEEEAAASPAPKKAARAGKGARKPNESQATSSSAADNTNSFTQPPPPRYVRRPRPLLFNDSGVGRRVLQLTPDTNRLDKA